MAVQFTIWDYWGSLLLLLFGSMGAFLLISIPLMRFLARKFRNIGITLLPMLLMIPLMWALFQYVVPIGERTDCLYPEERAYTHTTAGTITAVLPADHIPIYSFDGELRGGVCVTIDGVEYYSMAHPELQVGASLRFTYCPEEDLIMAFSPIEAGEVAALQTPFTGYEPPPEEPVSDVQRIIGSTLIVLGYLTLAASILFGERSNPYLAGFLQERDRRHRDGVVPSWFGPFAIFLIFLPIILIILGFVLTQRAYGGLFILFLVAVVFSILICSSRTRIHLEGRIIHVRKLRKTYTYPIDELRSVSWSRSHRFLYQRCLVLRFDSGELRLNQEEYWGLEDLHRRLSRILSQNQREI